MPLIESPEFENRIGIMFYATKTEGLGGIIRQKPSDFSVREVTNRTERAEGKYMIAELTKENWDTHNVIREISRRLGVSRNRLGFAGTKDKNAVTTQKISIWNVKEDELARVKIADVSLRILGRANKPVSLGDLYGNEFVIVIRAIKGQAEAINAKIAAITKEIKDANGVPNFFGVQRFGVSRPITHTVGKHLTRGELKEAVMSYLSDIFPDESEDAKRARMLCKAGQLKEALKIMPAFLRYEKAMLNELVKPGNEHDFCSAFSALPKNLQKLFVHAYQAYLFNLVLSARMKRNIGFNEALVGDVVCYRNELGFADPDKAERVTEDKIDAINRLLKRGRAFVTASVFGYETEFAEGVEGEIEREVLETEGVELDNFRITALSKISSKGTRRPILVPVSPGTEGVSDDDMNRGLKKVKLIFFLPKGSYATVVLREYMKNIS